MRLCPTWARRLQYRLPSVLLITAQRLARRLCASCKQPSDIPVDVLLTAGFKESDIDGTWAPPSGGMRCQKALATKGQVGIYEVMPITEDMQRIIMSNGNAPRHLRRRRNAKGYATCENPGLLKVKQGVTSLEEIEAVTNA